MNAQATLMDLDTANQRPLYMAFELGASTWKIAFGDGRPTARIITIPAGELDRVVDEIKKAKQRFEVLAR